MTSKLSIQQVKIGDLKPSEYNPRSWNEDTTEQLTESIKRFGLVDPILVNGSQQRKNIVIGGHFRLKVARAEGFEPPNTGTKTQCLTTWPRPIKLH